MTTTTKRDELTAMLALAREALADTQARGEEVEAWQVANVERIAADLAALGEGNGLVTSYAEAEGTARPLHARREAGSVAKNQYGTFTVRYASEKQTRFIKRLLDTRDLSGLNSSTVHVPLDVDVLRQQVADGKVNLKAASDIINRLLACPELATSSRMGYSGSSANGARQEETTMNQSPASDKQYAFITSLANEKALDAADRAKVLAAVEGKTLSAKGASATITKLLALPKAATPATEIEAGVYTDGTTILRVYLGQQSGKMLCAEAIKHDDGTAEFDYRGAASRFITAAFRKLSIEEAGAWGKATGTCVVCARRLDDPTSVDRGIGPICYGKMQG